MTLISVVLPVYKNQDILEMLYSQLKELFQREKLTYQIVFINDASPDDSLTILNRLAAQDSDVTLFSFEKNVGQHRAALKGMEMSRGSMVLLMDADLQDPPAMIPLLIAKLQEGYEAVFAARHGNYESLLRLATSKIFKTLLHTICNVPIDAGMFVIMSRSMVKAVLQIPMSVPFVVAMIGLTHLKTCSIPFIRSKRAMGISAYTTAMRLRIGMSALFQILRLKSHLRHTERQKEYYSKVNHSTIFPKNYPRYIQRHLKEALQYVPLIPQQRILEVGCGAGRFTLPLERREILVQKQLQIEALDISPDLIKALRANTSIPLHCADLTHSPSQLHGKFDVVIGFFVLHHLPDMDRAFQAISTLLKPGGKVLFVEPNPYNPLYYVQIICHPKMRWKNERYILSMRKAPIASAMQKAGLTHFAMHRYGFFPPFLSEPSFGAKLENILEKIPLCKPILPFQVFFAQKPEV
ncbi:MAG TPA: glycosyltransferase [Chlamydiales bacterium]|nr:glycosyltransferase [Chlamydiales bacterium]